MSKSLYFYAVTKTGVFDNARKSRKVQKVRLNWIDRIDRALLAIARTSIISCAHCALYTALGGALDWNPRLAKSRETISSLFQSQMAALRGPRIAVWAVFIANRSVFIMANTCSEFDARAPSYLPSTTIFSSVGLFRRRFIANRERGNRCSDFESASRPRIRIGFLPS